MAHLVIIDKPPISIAFAANNGVGLGAAVASQSFTGTNFNAADPTRLIVVGASTIANLNSPPSGTLSAVIGGVAATNITGNVLRSPSVGEVLSLFIAAVPTGTSGTVTISLSDTMQTFVSIGVWSIYNPTSASPVQFVTQSIPLSGGATTTLSLSATANGVAVGYVQGFVPVANTWAWSGLTEDFDTSGAATNAVTGASITGTSPRSISATASALTGDIVGVSAIWQ